MCDHCGCKTVPLIRELMEEHTALLDQSVLIRHALGAEQWELAESLVIVFTDALRDHVAREERGVFQAMRETGDFLEEVDALAGEHVMLDRALARLDPGVPDDLPRGFGALLEDLREHIQREELGIFPVAVVTLGSSGWDTVGRARHTTDRAGAWTRDHRGLVGLVCSDPSGLDGTGARMGP